MTLFSAREIAQLRALCVSAMDDDGTIVRPTFADDGAGQVTPGTPTQIAVVGRFWALSGDEQIAAAQLGQLGKYRYALPVTTTIYATDQIAILGTLYSVVWAPPVAALDAERIVGLEESGLPIPETPTTGGAGFGSPLWLLGMGASGATTTGGGFGSPLPLLGLGA